MRRRTLARRGGRLEGVEGEEAVEAGVEGGVLQPVPRHQHEQPVQRQQPRQATCACTDRAPARLRFWGFWGFGVLSRPACAWVLFARPVPPGSHPARSIAQAQEEDVPSRQSLAGGRHGATSVHGHYLVTTPPPHPPPPPGAAAAAHPGPRRPRGSRRGGGGWGRRG